MKPIMIAGCYSIMCMSQRRPYDIHHSPMMYNSSICGDLLATGLNQTLASTDLTLAFVVRTLGVVSAGPCLEW